MKDPAAPHPQRFVPMCCVEGCGDFGCYGLGVALRKGIEGRWYCPKHRPPKPPENANAVRTGAASAAPKIPPDRLV